jgi:hypothetical protein
MAEGDRDWTKPAALAIPKEGCFELERGRVWPGVPQDSGLLWVLHHCEGEGGPRGRGAGVRKDHRGDHRGESGGVGAAATALPALAAVSTSDRDCTSNTRASSTPTSTSTPRTRCSCSARPASRRCYQSRRIPRGLEGEAGGVHQLRPGTSGAEFPGVRRVPIGDGRRDDEIKKALRLKAAFSEILDQMQ